MYSQLPSGVPEPTAWYCHCRFTGLRTVCETKNAYRPPGLITNECVNLLPGPFPGANRTDSCINRLPGPSPGATRTNLCMNLLSDKPARNKKTRYIITYNIFLNNLYPVFWPKQDIIYIILYQITPRQCSSSLPPQHACVSLTVEMEAHRRSLQPESRCS